MLTGMTIEGIGLREIAISPASTVSGAIRKMKAEGLASLPVVEKGRLIGVVYLLDINNARGSERIRTLMRTGSTYLRLQNTADEAWEVMVKNKSTWVSVVEKGRYLGVVTLDSILKCYKGKIASLRRNQK
jgi:FOG: CBS domain